MYPSLKAVLLTHHNAPVAIREKYALSEGQTKDFLLTLRDVLNISEALVVSTCNRTEIYYTSEQNLAESIIKLLSIAKNTCPEKAKNYFESITDAPAAVRHLFEVAVGLDSQVVGDMQVPNQVKNAYQWAADVGLAAPFLHRLMHSIFFTSKKVNQETSFRDGAASTSYVAVELIEELTQLVAEPKILLLGVGEIGADVAKNLKGKFKNVVITNRTAEKAAALALECGFEARSFENVWHEIKEADVVVSSLAMQQTFIQKSSLQSFEVHSFKHFIDLAVPRSIDANIEDLTGVTLYNIDDLQQRTNETLQRRMEAVPAVRNLVNEAIAELGAWAKEMEVSPTIQKLKNALEQIRKEELARHLKEMTAQESELIEKITTNMVQKIIKLPIMQLKAACKRGEASTLIDVLNDLFNLEADMEVQK